MNTRITIVIVALVAAAVGAAIGILGYTWFVGGDGEASEPISAPTLDVNAIPTLNPTQAFAAVTQVAQLNAEISALQGTVEAMLVAPTIAPIEPTVIPEEPIATIEEPTSTPEEETTAGERAQYRIVPESSQVSFTLQEDLRGSRVTVVGTTNEVAGDIVIDMANPATSQIGTIRINARTLETDNSFRNRALRSNILRSAQDEYEFIEFVPTALNGLPESITIGETYTFGIVGNLTIRDTTKEVTFTTEVTITSDEQITGTATATVLYADWGISIPNAPGVANVTDDVTLTINFVAGKVS